MKPQSFRFSAPAKINLSLSIKGQRDDGYHLLESVMTFFPLYDTLDIIPGPGELQLTCDPPATLRPEENLVYRTAALLQSLSLKPVGATLHLKKRIPTAAGLGGGSSDAAVTMLALNELWGLQLSQRRLLELGEGLGADIPIFLGQWAALVEGIGERLTPCPGLPPLPLLVINPGIPLATATVFKAYAQQLTKSNITHNMPTANSVPQGEFVASRPQEPTVQSLLEETLQTMRNDLQPVAIKLLPIIADMMDQLRSEGALAVRMSGSGATVFGIFSNIKCAANSANRLRIRYPEWMIFHGETFNHHPFRAEWEAMNR